VGKEYVPLFNYFESRAVDGCFKVLADTYVTSDTGTGIVHCSPGFGADDYRVAVKAGIISPADPPVPIDENGRFKDLIADFKGMYVKDADKEVRKVLKANNRLLIDGNVRHNYPFCWRSETPLIYKAVHCWFIKVTDVKDKLVQNNKKSYWVPAFAQEGRFNNWLENAEDWCFSRNRFWGNPIPIWVSEDYEEQVCVGSVEELRQLSGVENITDLHRENIDHITIPSKKGKGVLRRIDEIFDCWFESGSMPYAQQHYPFTMKEEKFSQIFPADFIAEGIDQTRGWFYTLNVLATALRDDTPYKNLIVNGLVLNHEGKKMSKSKRNYPDPIEVINAYGADAVRLYLINSPLVRAENLNFKESGVKDTVRDVFLPWYNSYRLLLQNINRFESDNNQQFTYDEKIALSGQLNNLMDRWIIASA
jgi:isoleucyl-tRNA synthetase